MLMEGRDPTHEDWLKDAKKVPTGNPALIDTGAGKGSGSGSGRDQMQNGCPEIFPSLAASMVALGD